MNCYRMHKKRGLVLRLLLFLALLAGLVFYTLPCYNAFARRPEPLVITEEGQVWDSSGPELALLTWAEDPSTSQTITWLMPSKGFARVQFEKKEKFSGDWATARQKNAPGAPFAGGANHRHTVTITGLEPGTQYVYRLGREDQWSEPSTFATAPAETENISFLYLGDIHYGFEEWDSMVEQVYQEHPYLQFALQGGDITDNGNNEDEWIEFLEAASKLFSQIPFMPTMGNHDRKMYLDFLALPKNGPQGLQKEFYSFSYGNAHFIALNSNKNINETARQWLREDLQATDKKWKFAFFHHPAYPAFNDYKGIDRSIRENWIPILEEHGVDMVFVAHQHVYIRTHPIYQDEIQKDFYGIVYVMGNSGPKLYGLGEECPYIARAETGINYQLITIEGDELTLLVKNDRGKLIDQFTISKVKKETQPPMEIKLTIGHKETYLNGVPYTLDARPYINPEVNRTMVPLRFISELLGAVVDWIPETGKVNIFHDGVTLTLTIGSAEVLVEDRQQTLDCAPTILPLGHTFVPLRFVSETLKAQVNYQAETRTITITR